ncbi:iron complex transport system substrate-binding protein [Paenibacillus tianmuensis]|uniref:Iron complex transport system substrate-binding protein n=1 Tax=Paenibacillus tianmuensis TaxID=624147 RepID=A0A1G4PGW8_9BACL|nr:iron-hydroxamate ABC transporter substrate-binding protein [Paenibacillus tianmuensis]SCW31496.1 iron complex transport system substrate-binding protein [Paenibacillus tianmuensis]
MMKRRWSGIGAAALLALALSACGTAGQGKEQPAASSGTEKPAATAKEAAAPATKTIKYLGKDYTVPGKTDRIVISGAMEAMEDALVLGVKPIGAITVGGKFPKMFESITQGVESTGEKMQPNIEGILKMKPDVILGSSKFPPEMAEKLAKVAPTFPVSHISTNWEANLLLLGELTGKQEQAKQVLQKYKEDVTAAKAKLGDRLKDKKVVSLRVRTGNLYIYPEGVFFNASLYADLGFTAPPEVKAAKAQELISIEKFSEMNPDYIFLQFSEDENKDKPKALEDLQKNPIWQSINAVKNGKVFVNVVDPLGQGGTSWSKIQFLKAAMEKLAS